MLAIPGSHPSGASAVRPNRLFCRFVRKTPSLGSPGTIRRPACAWLHARGAMASPHADRWPRLSAALRLAQAGWVDTPPSTGLLNKATRKTENWRIRKGYSRRAVQPSRLHADPGGTASKRRTGKDLAGGVSQRRQCRNDKNPIRNNPQGLVLNKNRRIRRIVIWLRRWDSNPQPSS